MKRTWYTVQQRAGADIATLPALTLAEARRAFREARAEKAESRKRGAPSISDAASRA